MTSFFTRTVRFSILIGVVAASIPAGAAQQVGSDKRPTELERRQGEIRGELGTGDKRDTDGPDSGVGRVEPRQGGEKDPKTTLQHRSTDNETGVEDAAEAKAVEKAQRRTDKAPTR